MANKDKNKYRKEKLEEGITQREKWKGIKDTKGKFVPKFTKQKDIHGNRVKYGEKARATAEYLEMEQWKKIENEPRRKYGKKVINKDLKMNVEEFSDRLMCADAIFFGT